MHGWVRRMKLNLLWLLCERGSRKLSNVYLSIVDEAVLLGRAAYVDVWAGATLLNVVQVLSTVALAGHSFEIEHSLTFMRRVANGVVFHRRHVIEVRRGWGLKGVRGDWSIVCEALVREIILNSIFGVKMVLLWVPVAWLL